MCIYVYIYIYISVNDLPPVTAPVAERILSRFKTWAERDEEAKRLNVCVHYGLVDDCPLFV
jgi:hypothetical protein